MLGKLMKPELEMHFEIHENEEVVSIGPDEDGLGLIKISHCGMSVCLSKDAARLLAKAVTRLCEENDDAN
jgi:hypothetical protein